MAMRTTLDLAKPVLEELKSLQKKQGGTMGELASQILAEGLGKKKKSSLRDVPIGLQWHSQDMGAKVNLHDKEALYRAMDQA
ncbi:MAG: hypothetical protein EBY83_05045 [Verrucomicrobia bacterium]|nr:hypothetical protein [Verrucomicrobiota bacterium]